MVLNNVGYVGICQSEFQKQHIKDKLVREMFANMRHSTSKVYAPAYATEFATQQTTTGQGSTGQPPGGAPPPKKPKTAIVEKVDTAGAQAAGTSTNTAAATGGLSAALQKMLEAAKTAANPSA